MFFSSYRIAFLLCFIFIIIFFFVEKMPIQRFLQIKTQLSLKYAWLPLVFFLHFISFWYDLLASHRSLPGEKHFPSGVIPLPFINVDSRGH